MDVVVVAIDGLLKDEQRKPVYTQPTAFGPAIPDCIILPPRLPKQARQGPGENRHVLLLGQPLTLQADERATSRQEFRPD